MGALDNTNKKWLRLVLIPVITAVGVAVASIAFAALTFSGLGITGDSSGVTIDSSSTISIGTSTATAVNIGNGSSTVTVGGAFEASPQGNVGGFYVQSSTGYIGNNPTPVAPIDFSNNRIAYNGPQQILFADTLVQGTGLTNIAPLANVTITDGSLVGGGPTYTCETCRWNAGSVGSDGTTAITLDFGQSYPIMGVTFGAYARNGCTLGGVAIDGSNDGNTWTNIGNPTYSCQQIALFGHGGYSGPTLGNYQYLRISYTVAGVSNEMAGLQVFTNAGVALWGDNPWAVSRDGASTIWHGLGVGGGVGGVGIGIPPSSTIMSLFAVGGNVAIGSYAESSSAPTNGLIVSGDVGIGTSAPSTTLQVAGVSSTVRIGSASLTGCLELGNSDGSGGINYITVLNGVLSATTTKPNNCE